MGFLIFIKQLVQFQELVLLTGAFDGNCCFVGLGVSASFNTSNTLLIDLHRGKPATATAAVNFVRCLISAGGVAAIVPMVQAMNPGWCFTFWGLLFIQTLVKMDTFT